MPMIKLPLFVPSIVFLITPLRSFLFVLYFAYRYNYRVAVFFERFDQVTFATAMHRRDSVRAS